MTSCDKVSFVKFVKSEYFTMFPETPEFYPATHQAGRS